MGYASTFEKAFMTGEIIRNGCIWSNAKHDTIMSRNHAHCFCKLTHTWCDFSLKLLKFYKFSSTLTKKRTKNTDINAFTLFHQQGFP